MNSTLTTPATSSQHKTKDFLEDKSIVKTKISAAYSDTLWQSLEMADELRGISLLVAKNVTGSREDIAEVRFRLQMGHVNEPTKSS